MTTPRLGDADELAGGPTVLRILLGRQLRRLREAKGVSREAAGWEIRASESKISRMELGRVGFKTRDVADLLTLYGVTDPHEREALLAVAEQANTPGWWHRYNDTLPKWFESYLGLEGAASLIRTYEVQFVPGLLQTPDYARAVIALGHGGAPAAEIERRVALRMERQQVLTRPDAAHLWVVVDESALRRPMGGREVMRGQLAALIKATTQPNITIQVLPFEAGGHAAAGGAFTVLRFPEPDLPDVVYMEQLTGALYIEQREEVDAYIKVMERVCVEADPPDRTVETIERILRRLDDR
ncbi:MAG TPA: helix-turn-helix transcriptional regulator [Natronosporangium sp.]